MPRHAVVRRPRTGQSSSSQHLTLNSLEGQRPSRLRPNGNSRAEGCADALDVCFACEAFCGWSTERDLLAGWAGEFHDLRGERCRRSDSCPRCKAASTDERRAVRRSTDACHPNMHIIAVACGCSLLRQVCTVAQCLDPCALDGDDASTEPCPECHMDGLSCGRLE